MPNNDWELWGQALHDWKEFTRRNPKKILPMGKAVVFFLMALFYFTYTVGSRSYYVPSCRKLNFDLITINIIWEIFIT